MPAGDRPDPEDGRAVVHLAGCRLEVGAEVPLPGASQEVLKRRAIVCDDRSHVAAIEPLDIRREKGGALARRERGKRAHHRRIGAELGEPVGRRPTAEPARSCSPDDVAAKPCRSAFRVAELADPAGGARERTLGKPRCLRAIAERQQEREAVQAARVNVAEGGQDVLGKRIGHAFVGRAGVGRFQ